jgi:uncharacterized protein
VTRPSDDELDVSVIYALPERDWHLPLRMPRGSTVGEAIVRSGIAALVPGLDPDTLAVGIFSRPCSHDTVLRDGDRVELYRPLLCDPKQVRRQRAEASRPPRPGRK